MFKENLVCMDKINKKYIVLTPYIFLLEYSHGKISKIMLTKIIMTKIKTISKFPKYQDLFVLQTFPKIFNQNF